MAPSFALFAPGNGPGACGGENKLLSPGIGTAFASRNRGLAIARRCVDAATPSEFAPLLYARVDFLRDDDGRLRLSELELVEPSLFFRHAPHAADMLADALLARVE